MGDEQNTQHLVTFTPFSPMAVRKVEMKPETVDEDEESPIHGDILDLILAKVPLIDLIPSSSVCKAWKSSVSSSLRHFNPIKPWLIVHTQTNSFPYLTATHAYDPRSNLWLEIKQPPIKYISTLRSSHSSFLYMLSPTKFSFSFDPLYLNWFHSNAPLVWRGDPIVALIGRRIVIAGGTCDFVHDPLTMEIYDVDTRTWEVCDDMPSIFMDYAASTWLSTAVDGRRMYVAQRNSGVTYSFNPVEKSWFGPFYLNTGRLKVFSSAIGFAGNLLLLVGYVGTTEGGKSVKVYKAEDKSIKWKEIGEMPTVMIEKLKGKSGQEPSILMTSSKNIVYIHNALDPGEMIVCEIVLGNLLWGSVENLVVNHHAKTTQKVILTASDVRIDDIRNLISTRVVKLV